MPKTRPESNAAPTLPSGAADNLTGGATTQRSVPTPASTTTIPTYSRRSLRNWTTPAPRPPTTSRGEVYDLPSTGLRAARVVLKVSDAPPGARRGLFQRVGGRSTTGTEDVGGRFRLAVNPLGAVAKHYAVREVLTVDRSQDRGVAHQCGRLPRSRISILLAWQCASYSAALVSQPPETLLRG